MRSHGKKIVFFRQNIHRMKKKFHVKFKNKVTPHSPNGELLTHHSLH